MFKIIALQLHTPPIGERCTIPEEQLSKMDMCERVTFDIANSRYHSITKGLQTEEPYFFYAGYKLVENKMVQFSKPIEDDFFIGTGSTPISVCSIVGENGCGKSTVIDIIIRLLNNISYALRNGFVEEGLYDDADDYALHFIKDIYASLYFHTDEGIYVVKQMNDRMSFWLQDSQDPQSTDFSYIFYDMATPSDIDSSKARTRLSRLFYNVVVNYAAYAYNTNDYMPEWDDISERGVNPEDYTESLLCWFTSLFHKNDDYQIPIVINPYRDRGLIDFNNENTLLRDRLFELIEAFRGEKKKTLTSILQGKEVTTFFIDENDEYMPIAGYGHVCRRVVNIMQRAQLVGYNWKENKSEKDKIEKVSNTIIDAWQNALGGIDLRNYIKETDERQDITRALNYVVYKTIKITLTYDSYYRYRYFWNNDVELANLVDDLKRVNSHVTRKLRKSLAFLVHHHYKTKPLDEFNHISNEIKVDDFIATALRNVGKETDCIKWSLADMMPAPCFNTDIRFTMPGGAKLALSSFSSGEKQMLHLICTVIYHLINLHTVVSEKPSNKVSYRYINLMIDEIELYFHPRYQTTLLDFLLNAIQSLKLEGVSGINIMIATHSPYLLSDIPSANILKLEKGVPSKEDNNENFGANVYDILHNKFFMSQYVGDFAKKKVSEIISEVVAFEGHMNDDLKRKINLIGDSLIRNTLLQQIEDDDKGYNA